MSKKHSLKTTLPALHAIQPWECRHHKDHSEITAYVEASGTWERIATIHSTAGASAEKLAGFIAAVVNEHQQSHLLLQDAMEALETVMQEGLNYSTEQAADRVVSRYMLTGQCRKRQNKKSRISRLAPDQNKKSEIKHSQR